MPSIQEAMAQAVALHQRATCRRPSGSIDKSCRPIPAMLTPGTCWASSMPRSIATMRPWNTSAGRSRSAPVRPSSTETWGHRTAGSSGPTRPSPPSVGVGAGPQLCRGPQQSRRGPARPRRAARRRSQPSPRIHMNPAYSDALCNLGNVLLALERPAEALACQQKAVDLRPRSAEAHHGVGTAPAALDRLDNAVAAYRRALELNEKDPGTYNNLGVALKKQNRLDEATAAYHRAGVAAGLCRCTHEPGQYPL